MGGVVGDHLADALAGVVGDEVGAWTSDAGAAAIRVLQLGAGSGELVAAVLDRLRALGEPVEDYLCADADEAALRRVRDRLGDVAPVRLARVDLELALDEQGVEPGSYDVVVAAGGLSTARDVRGAVRTVKAALARHGLLVLAERTGPSLFEHLVFGLHGAGRDHEDEPVPATAPARASRPGGTSCRRRASRTSTRPTSGRSTQRGG